MAARGTRLTTCDSVEVDKVDLATWEDRRLAIQLESDPHRHLEFRTLAVLDRATLLDDFKPVQVLHRLGRLNNCDLHRLCEADRRSADHIDELVNPRHRVAPWLRRSPLYRFTEVPTITKLRPYGPGFGEESDQMRSSS